MWGFFLPGIEARPCAAGSRQASSAGRSESCKIRNTIHHQVSFKTIFENLPGVGLRRAQRHPKLNVLLGAKNIEKLKVWKIVFYLGKLKFMFLPALSPAWCPLSSRACWGRWWRVRSRSGCSGRSSWGRRGTWSGRQKKSSNFQLLMQIWLFLTWFHSWMLIICPLMCRVLSTSWKMTKLWWIAFDFFKDNFSPPPSWFRRWSELRRLRSS